MHQRILIAYDGTPSSRAALEECLAINLQDAEIHIVVVIHDLIALGSAGEYVPALAFEQDTEHAEKDLQEAAAFLARHGLQAQMHSELGEPIEVISKLVRDWNIDLLIIGHRRELSLATRLLRGSTGAGLMDRVHCSILIAPDGEEVTGATTPDSPRER